MRWRELNWQLQTWQLRYPTPQKQLRLSTTPKTRTRFELKCGHFAPFHLYLRTGGMTLSSSFAALDAGPLNIFRLNLKSRCSTFMFGTTLGPSCGLELCYISTMP